MSCLPKIDLNRIKNHETLEFACYQMPGRKKHRAAFIITKLNRQGMQQTPSSCEAFHKTRAIHEAEPKLFPARGINLARPLIDPERYIYWMILFVPRWRKSEQRVALGRSPKHDRPHQHRYGAP